MTRRETPKNRDADRRGYARDALASAEFHRLQAHMLRVTARILPFAALRRSLLRLALCADYIARQDLAPSAKQQSHDNEVSRTLLGGGHP